VLGSGGGRVVEQGRFEELMGRKGNFGLYEFLVWEVRIKKEARQRSIYVLVDWVGSA
jgi:hypothetical protein